MDLEEITVTTTIIAIMNKSKKGTKKNRKSLING